MKFSIVILFFSLLVSCATIKTEVISATSKKWSGGAAQQRGTNFQFQLRASKNIQIDSVYIGADCFAIQKKSPEAGSNNWYYENGTYHVSIRHIEFQERRVPERPMLEKSDCPIVKYDGVALLVYSYKGKRRTQTIRDFQELPSVAYP